MKYFKSKYQNLGELRTEYYNLAKVHHPDMGGTDEAMKNVNNEYEKIYKLVAAGQYEDFSKWSTEFKEKFYTSDVELREAIDRIIHLPKVNIEVCGSWIWITGETKPVKEELKELKYRFSGKKQAWYWHGAGYKKRSKKTYDLDEIRSMFGSEKIEKEELDQIEK